jgi:hypothetical protein
MIKVFFAAVHQPLACRNVFQAEPCSSLLAQALGHAGLQSQDSQRSPSRGAGKGTVDSRTESKGNQPDFVGPNDFMKLFVNGLSRLEKPNVLIFLINVTSIAGEE